MALSASFKTLLGASLTVGVASLAATSSAAICAAQGPSPSCVSDALAEADLSGVSLLQVGAGAKAAPAAAGAAPASTVAATTAPLQATPTAALPTGAPELASLASAEASVEQPTVAPSKVALPQSPATKEDVSVRKGLRVLANTSETCEKLTGGTCFLSQCAESRGATCSSTGQCVCPDFMCATPEGTCILSPTEVVNSISNGLSSEQVTNIVSQIAGTVPGAADSISSRAFGAVQGVVGAATTIVGSVMGFEGDCPKMVSTCVFSGCPESVALTATCSYGVCMCKENFCHSWIGGASFCNVDIAKVLQIASR